MIRRAFAIRRRYLPIMTNAPITMAQHNIPEPTEMPTMKAVVNNEAGDGSGAAVDRCCRCVGDLVGWFVVADMSWPVGADVGWPVGASVNELHPSNSERHGENRSLGASDRAQSVTFKGHSKQFCSLMS